MPVLVAKAIVWLFRAGLNK